MKLCLLLITAFPLIAFSQPDYKDSFVLKMPWQEQVRKGMQKHHNAYQASTFYQNNVIRQPVSVSLDSMVYNVKMQVNLSLWGGIARFYPKNGQLFCELSDITFLKKAGEDEINFVHVKLKDIEDTPGNRMNLKGIKGKIKDFFERFE